MKKVGILTFHNTTNYGAALQAYALQTKINHMGYKCDTIDYINKEIEDIYKPKNIKDIKGIKQFAKYLLNNNNQKKVYNTFSKFYKEHMKFSKRVNKTNVCELNNDYDKFIVGSDQVWNLNLSYQDQNYYLKFVTDNVKKNSYAASFGYKEVPEEYKEFTKNALSEFHNISVRENQGRDIIKSLLNRDVSVVLDPTLLLERKEWTDLINDEKKEEQEDYILLYIVSPNEEIIKFSRMLAKKYNCKILWINNTIKKLKGIKNIRGCGPIEFLKYIKNAKYIVTTSFHGVALSVALNKQFFYGLSKEKNNFNSRIISLVDILKLCDRDIASYSNDKIQNINYDEINSILEKQREISIEYLKKVLSE